MTEKEILDLIKQSAQDIEVPESLSPERILEKCKEQGDGGKDKSVKKLYTRKQAFTAGLTAALLFIICGVSAMTYNRQAGFHQSASESGEEEMMMEEAAAVAEDAVEEEAVMTEEPSASEPAAGADGEAPERRNAGELYTLADGYEVIYERLEEEKAVWDMESGRGGIMDLADGFMEAETATSGTAFAESTMEDAGNDVANARKEMANQEETGYSRTNVQTLGIDESDIIKTDGEYIYTLRGSQVTIIKAGEKLEPVGEIAIDAGSGSAEACAMYVDGDVLVMMIQENLASLEQQARKYAEEDIIVDYIDSETVTSVLTYDIRDKEAPVLLGQVTQDGSYLTSRKDGTMMYLFTSQYLADEYENENSDVIPRVNEEKIAEDCIYIGDSGTRALVISSVSLRNPDEARDTVMLLDNGAEVYMGADSLYLYRGSYKNNSEQTEIAKFSMTGGYLNGVAAISLKGSIQDTFAINEKDHKLRVLTTDFSGNDWENSLFMLDENLKVTGKLERIAVGESIYAARFLGDMAYFITYRNTDPLFVADLSDETAPKLTGELEITGFSEYLHFWGEDKLLGIGYETDPDSGARKGIKLVMFDMSDPAKPEILGTKVLKDTDYSPAMYNYKAVLADPEENLIGFATEGYKNDRKYRYELFGWNGTGFENILSEDIKDGYSQDNYRGIYIGDKFYIANPEIIRYYDRADYSLKQTFKAGKE